MMKNTVSLLILFAVMSVSFPVVIAQESPQNQALGKKYTLSPKPTYIHCTDPDDIMQLTDGQTTSDYFWTQKGTVGWTHVPYAEITVDLERIEPIGGVEMTSAAGVAGVTWPAAVFIHVSDDGKIFHNAGELLSLDLKVNGALPEQYAIRCFSTRDLRTRGRFVRFLILSGGNYIFTDEVRVLRGDDSLLSGEVNGDVVSASPQEFVEAERFRSALRRRHVDDISSLRQILSEAKIDEDTRTIIAERSREIESAVNDALIRQSPPFDNMPENFRTIFPIGGLHQEIFQLQAALWRATGMTVHAVPVSSWDKVTLFDIPSKECLDSRKPIEVHTLLGEYRAAAFNLYNATNKPIDVSIRIDGIPRTEFTVHDVPWTDTAQFEPVLSALPDATAKNDAFAVTVFPGLVKQVYLTFRPVNLPPKLHAANIVLDFAGATSQPSPIPLELTVWPLRFPEKPSLLVGGWSYTNGSGAYSVNEQNRNSFLKHLHEHFVNAPWARPSVVMNFNIDKTTNSVTLDTKELDDWLAQWPDAREYCIFLSVGGTIQGIQHDAPDFDAAVTAWITAWVGHWESKGIQPERINLLVSDEPGLDYDLSATFAWCRAIRKAQPKLKLWVDPVYTDLPKAPKAVFEFNDVICPNRPQWLQHRRAFDAFYFDWRHRGKTLQLYSCSGPVRLLDPYSYFRLQAWECARIGGTGSFFWAFGDGGGASSWNEYVSPRTMYTPLFIDPADPIVVGGKQMEAIREGTEDFEIIRLLVQRIEQHKAEGKSAADAEAILKEAIDGVLFAEGAASIYWKDPKDRSLADRARLRILETIVALSE